MPNPVLPLPAASSAAALVLVAGFLEGGESLLSQGLALIMAAYRQAPVLVLVLSTLLILPAVAIVSYAIHSTKRRRSQRAAVLAAQRRAQAGEWTGEVRSGISMPAWHSQAWLTIEGKALDTRPLAGQTVRIGRHEDNDIRLGDSSVHRYHAVIERTAEESFVIIDISGKEGNGIRINGERTAQARLVDGDVIELGRARLKFESAPI